LLVVRWIVVFALVATLRSQTEIGMPKEASDTKDLSYVTIVGFSNPNGKSDSAHDEPGGSS
jgi:hypothetical protein